MKKKKIPRGIKEQVWLTYIGKKFEDKCYIDWCVNKINVFNFHTGHDIPESKGGTLDLHNLKPICPRCNYSMADKFSIAEWNATTQRMTCWKKIKKIWFIMRS